MGLMSCDLTSLLRLLYKMTTLTLNQANRFRENLRNGESLLEKAGKIIARINSTLLDAVRLEIVEKEVDLQFDKIICSVNDQLKIAEENSQNAIREIKSLNSYIVGAINKTSEHDIGFLSDIATFCSLLITATALVMTQIRGTRRNLVSSGIDRACIAECADILERLEDNCRIICDLLEDVSMNAQIYDALLEPSLTKSINPELNSILG